MAQAGPPAEARRLISDEAKGRRVKRQPPLAKAILLAEECGHPEMCRLPDGVFHCPACGSEVLPAKGFWQQE